MFLENAAVFIALALTIIAGLFTYVAVRKGSIAAARDYFLKNEGPGILKGIVLALVVTVLFALAATVAHAEPVKWGGPTTVFLGLEATKGQSPMCYDKGGVNDRLTSNIGVRQRVASWGAVRLGAQYTHHSCAINRDREGYDAAGVVLEWTIN